MDPPLAWIMIENTRKLVLNIGKQLKLDAEEETKEAEDKYDEEE